MAGRATQVHAAAGTPPGGPVEPIFRNLRIFRVTTGASGIHKNAIAKDLPGAAAP